MRWSNPHQIDSEGNIKYRYVHLILATAEKNDWKIEHYPIQNCEKSEHNIVENRLMRKMDCNMNDGDSWFVEDFEQLSKKIS